MPNNRIVGIAGFVVGNLLHFISPLHKPALPPHPRHLLPLWIDIATAKCLPILGH